MIVTVTPNPALDITYEIGDDLQVGQVHRVETVRTRPGGKGVNVARILHVLGCRTLVTGLAGGPSGLTLDSMLAERGLTADFVDALPDVRRTVVVRDAAGAVTSMWEPGRAPADPVRAAAELLKHVQRRLPGTECVAVCGSLPPGIDAELPARIARQAAAAGVPVMVDTHGDPLRAALTAGDAVLTPNVDELAALVGDRPTTPAGAVAMTRDLVSKHGSPAIVTTLGEQGIVAVSDDLAVHARPPRSFRGNTTGAGDAACASIARHVAAAGVAVDWRLVLADAVALSAASVATPVAGEFDAAAYTAVRGEVAVETL